MKKNCIVYLDPLEGFDDEIISKMLQFLRIQIFLNTGKNMNCDNWTVQDASASSETFPTQNDSDSCGVYVCLYVVMLLKKAVLEALQRSLHNPSTRFAGNIGEYVFKENHPFGLKEMLLLRNLDETILTMASADENSVGENLERHVHRTFLRDPKFFMDCTW